MQDLDDFFKSLLADKKEKQKVGEDEDDTEIAAGVLNKFREVSVWQSIARVLLIQRQTCACGAVHEFSQGEFLRQKHLRIQSAFRLIPNSTPLALPKEAEFHDSSIEICSKCQGEWK